LCHIHSVTHIWYVTSTREKRFTSLGAVIIGKFEACFAKQPTKIVLGYHYHCRFHSFSFLFRKRMKDGWCRYLLLQLGSCLDQDGFILLNEVWSLCSTDGLGYVYRLQNFSTS
jgi:hypothetical protein